MSTVLTRLGALLAERPAATTPRQEGVREAAVAVLLREAPALEVLLIHRAELEGDPWSGHIALPGGRREPADPTLLDTAVREAEEELRAPVGRVGRPLGSLPEITPRSPRLPPIVIAPYVLSVPRDLRLDPDPAEVQAAFWVPLVSLRDESASTEVVLTGPDGERRLPGVRHGRHVVWGLTLGALESLFRVVDLLG